jgi:hypothetical protein
VTKKKPASSEGWMPPRGGGYRPGRNTANGAAQRDTARPAPPPKGGAGIGRSKDRRNG